MDFLHAISLALAELASPAVLAAVLGGTMIGLISGAMPGVALPGLVVLLSVASTMPVPVAIALPNGYDEPPIRTSDSGLLSQPVRDWRHAGRLGPRGARAA